jgi:hypothetical protein
MRGFRVAEDGRLSRLPHIRSLCLSCEQQRVRVGIGTVEDDPGQEADDAEGDEGGVDVPPRQEVGDGPVELIEESRHVSGYIEVKFRGLADSCGMTAGVNDCS